ncbi:hypothetical protein [Haloarchaeobius sp. HRN-SO-5]|uniref:hypothetical protein n=1 Tax=Haloarchaeobius sp. HRN-SO-5 TaxID=3446118 RepID=UPI003EB9FAD7
MTELGDDTQAAMCYPKKEQYLRWRSIADERDYNSVSRFMIEMIEVGYKQIDPAIGYDDDANELRKQRNDLKQELHQTRDRLQEVEEQLYRGERESVVAFLEERQSATFAELVQHIIDDAPVRVAELLDELDGDDIKHVDGEYHLLGESDDV